jgi:hypothetical protein
MLSGQVGHPARIFAHPLGPGAGSIRSGAPRSIVLMKGLTRVSIGLETSREELEAVEGVFTAADIHVLVDPEIARFSVDSPWVMYLTAPLDAFAARFDDGGGTPPNGRSTGVKSFIDNVAAAFGGRDGSVVFTDEESEVIIALTDGLPEQAYSDLLSLDLMEIEGKRIAWDADEGAWCTLGGEVCPKR